MLSRRAFLGLALLPLPALAQKADYPPVLPGRKLVFPRDHGAHPGYRSERWDVSGWLESGPETLGFQITFFRTLSEAGSQALSALAAISAPKLGRLLHDRRAARAGASLAEAEIARTGVWIDDWTLTQERLRYEARIAARDFKLELGLYAKDLVLQGEDGFSRRGPRSGEASYHYSRPHIPVTGALDGRSVTGTAWLDHEWSSANPAPEAAGRDWCGINLTDGKALMAFRMRDRQGGTLYAPPGVSFKPLRNWRSPRTGAAYPVEMQVNDLVLKPLMDDQELDLRASANSISWQGAVTAMKGGKPVGRGYLQLTGY